MRTSIYAAAVAVALVSLQPALAAKGQTQNALVQSTDTKPSKLNSERVKIGAPVALSGAEPQQPAVHDQSVPLGTPPSWLDHWLARVGIFVAMIAAAAAVTNAFWTRLSNRFANSIGMYRRFLELCVQYPEFAEPFPIDRYKDSDEKDSNDVEYRRYQWFLGVLFRACEEVLDHGNDRRRWTKTVIDQLRHHREFIDNNTWLNNGGLELYSPRLKRLIILVRQEARTSQAFGMANEVVGVAA